MIIVLLVYVCVSQYFSSLYARFNGDEQLITTWCIID